MTLSPEVADSTHSAGGPPPPFGPADSDGRCIGGGGSVSIASTCRISGGITCRSTRRGHPADRDRRRSFEFYQQVLGVDAVGEQADDGVPEPLQFPLNDGVRLMLIPRGGFGWVVQPRTGPRRGTESVSSPSSPTTIPVSTPSSVGPRMRMRAGR